MSDTKSGLPATQSAGAEVYDFGEHGGQGFKKDIDPTELAIPYLKVLQASSKEVQENDNAKAGYITNSVTGEVTKAIAANEDPGLVFCPVNVVTMYKEAFPFAVKKGIGSYVASHKPDSDFVASAIEANGGNKYGRIPCANGEHELTEVKYVFGLILSEDGQSYESYAIFPIDSVKLGPLKKWLTSMYTVKAGNPPLYAFRCVIKTVKQPNKEGADSYNIKVTPFGGTNWKECIVNPGEDWGAEILKNGKNMLKAIEDKTISVDFKSMSDDDGSDSNSSSKASKETEGAPY